MIVSSDKQLPRILHAAAMDYPPIGVLQQMQWEFDAAKSLGLAWQPCIYTARQNSEFEEIIVSESNSARLTYLPFRLFQRFSFNLRFLFWLNTQSKKVDVILLRYKPHDLLQSIFIAWAKIPVLTVHHTIEPAELSEGGGPVGVIRAFMDKVFGAIGLSRVSGIVSVTKEILDYQTSRCGLVNKKTARFIYPNGILAGASIRRFDDEQALPKGEQPEILFVASSFVPWHGLDRLLQSCGNYHDSFVLHIVGDVPDELHSALAKDARFVMHGRLDHKKINDLSRSCWIGLSSLALDRKGMREACTLKVREYLCNGLPVYAGHKDVFPEDFPYYREGEPNIASVIEYAYQVKDAPAAAVFSSAVRYIDKVVLLEKLYTELAKSNLN